ncbi:lysophospholipid acyltransferase family protein [uncultured Fusobacterium sp.]|uniref:lysophospholipid acyltransferase family protein n=1 Tax=uncultured Fusobacterium sp. TaxID=159267 RepID=UPI0025D75265|nr:lysophospholipid acyltransferase family protein [uncultured Fusobacterium sp.]MCF2640708.1 lysophospholipid acyltransferase family protein [Fusobacterium varium]
MYRLQYWIVMIFRFILLLFPQKLRFKFAEFLGWLGYVAIKKRRETALMNLKLAFPNKSEKEREEIALESYKIMLKAFLCSLWFKEYFKNKENVKTVNKEAFEKAYAKGKGVIVALMHMGNMEASVKAVDGYSLVTVAKKQRNPYIDEFITESRERDLNLTLLKKSKGTSKELIKRLNNQNIIALFSDHRDKGAIVDFFGESAKAPTGAVSLALKFDIPLLLVYNTFNEDNSCTVHVLDEIELIKTDSFKDDVINNTQNLIHKMEDVIREYPEQWMWFHDRWNLYSKYSKLKKKK